MGNLESGRTDEIHNSAVQKSPYKIVCLWSNLDENDAGPPNFVVPDETHIKLRNIFGVSQYRSARDREEQQIEQRYAEKVQRIGGDPNLVEEPSV